ncbi:thioesterase [Devosia soli]|uniref:Thioesterase n=1 Tax=Devosia soli TaxID=361041 RepID=A0A0F5LBK5_9HYPH|nr:YiiD C-terminal domain-containing protein [Devosia soli]KKB79771.1 thioesterase [Devosia soli]
MNANALQRYLHTHIPLSSAMGVEVLEASVDRVRLAAPLAPNLNMHGTVFGGSGATLALLAAWSVVHLRLEAEGLASQLVIHHSTMDYLLPIHGSFAATASLEAVDTSDFFTKYRRKGRARLSLSAELTSENAIAGRFTGEFVAISAP